MKNLPATIFLILSGIQSYGQKVELIGRIEDQQTHKALPYATLEVFSLKTGTVADQKGDFRLELPLAHSVADTLVFSCVGYEKIKMGIADFLNHEDKTISLKEDQYLLPDVVVLPKKYKTITIGITANKPESKQITNIFNNKIGNFIENKRAKTGWIKTVGFYLDEEGHPETPFRVRIFGVNTEKNCPGRDILKENLVVSAGKPGWFNIDVSDYHLQFPPEGAFVVMEWINAGDNYFYDKEITRKNEKGEIVKETRKFYGQAIGSVYKQPALHTWGITLGNEWTPFSLFYKGYINAMIHTEIAFPME
jgi:hypothetical protein